MVSITDFRAFLNDVKGVSNVYVKDFAGLLKDALNDFNSGRQSIS